MTDFFLKLGVRICSDVSGDLTGSLKTRLLPLQLLGERATATEHKVFRMNMALTAETGNPEVALLRTYSLAFDMGVESKMFTAPSSATASEAFRDQFITTDAVENKLDLVCLPCPKDEILDQVDRMCPRALPLGDADHVACQTC